MARLDNLDWTGLNSLRRYPIREGASVLSADGNFSVPDTLIVDFTLSASSDVTRRFYISEIFNKISSVSITVSDDLGVVVGTAEINKATHTQDADYYLTATNAYAGSNGRITVGILEDLAFQPSGIYTFARDATEFEPRTIIPGLRGLDRITFVDAVEGNYTVSGNAVVTARNNLRFVLSNQTIIMDAGDNLGLNKECALTNCIQTINGIAPDPITKDFSFLGINCLSVYSPEAYTLALEDNCCTPCAGCAELEELTTRLTSLENKFLALKDSYNSVNTQLGTYLSTINSNCSC